MTSLHFLFPPLHKDGKLSFLKSCASNERTVVLDVPSGATYKLVLQPEDNVGNFRSAARGASSLTVIFPFAEGKCMFTQKPTKKFLSRSI